MSGTLPGDEEITIKTVEDWLDEVDYHFLNSGGYKPSIFALKFMNFIKLVNGNEGESHKTPVVHLAMLDRIVSGSPRVANLCARGMAKTTLMFEYLFLYIAVFGELDGFGEISGMIYVSDSMDNGVKSARKNIEFRWENSEFLQEWLPHAKFTDNYIETKSKNGHRLGCKMFGAQTGIRGTKIFAKRPTLAVLDDLLSDSAAKSPAELRSIKDTVHKGINFALDPVRRKTLLNGTPFIKQDILVESVESGAWEVNVWPICERFPCEKKDFASAWPDRFTYEYVLDQYESALKQGELSAFQQELMLRISTPEERLVQDAEIRWYSRTDLLRHKARYNYYITTDFAVSDKQSADNSVISVWAYNANGEWYWVDGVCARQTFEKTLDDLFRLVIEYRPQSVGVETSATQKAFIPILRREMMARNIWFSFAMENGIEGIKPTVNKLARFNIAVPLFKTAKIFFPDEMKLSKIMQQFVSEISLATRDQLKGKDDCLDTISMLPLMNPWKPTEAAPIQETQEGVFGPLYGRDEEEPVGISSYVV